ncbi:mucin-2-like isoform X3 [Ischnura elegans]|uniref:mucin-2-like isoform X3 n=1 Tax=Ischnura elegans TaxID=197161 RepID=UPI001ED8855B|nr:mucin-2-like isoform X3 [Ischnura elegans]
MDNRLRLTKMEWTASLLLVLCLVSSVQLCTISNSNGEIPPDSNGVILQEIYVKDIYPTGKNILELTTHGVNGIDPPAGYNGYVGAVFNSTSQKIALSLEEKFKDYEEVQEKNTIEVRFNVQCPERTILNIRLHINDTDNHETKFSREKLSYSLPMPYPPGLEITQGSNLWAYDFDITSEVEVSFENSSFSDYLELKTDAPKEAGGLMPGHESKTITLFHIRSSAQLNQDLNFNLTARDVKNGGKIVNKLSVAILQNKTISVPDSPMFSKPLYRTSVDCDMGSGSILEFPDGAIKLPIPNVDGLDVALDGDHPEYFSKVVTDTEVKIKLNKKVTGVDIKYALLTLKASIPKAKHDGYAVVFVEFLPNGCPTPPPPTTTACPTEPTTTKGTTVDPCSFCPTSTTTECPTTPESSCPPCEYTTPNLTTMHPSTTVETSTQECICPSTTECPTISEPTCPPCECTTPTSTTIHLSSTVETSTQECICPTVTEVQCPTTPQPPTCQPCEPCTSSSVTTSERTTTPECICPTCPDYSCPTCPEVSCPTGSTSTTTEFSSSSFDTTIDPCSSCPIQPCSTVSESTSTTDKLHPSCPPCECTTESWTTQTGNYTQETTTTDCSCPTCPVSPTCPPCENTTPNSTPVHTSTSAESSTHECICPTVTEVQCPTTPEPPTCPPCENTTPYLTTMHPFSTPEASTTECNCPTTTEVQCPTITEPPSCPPCDECTTPKWTTANPSTTGETSTEGCNCPTVTEAQCPTSTEPPTCPPCKCTTPEWTTRHQTSPVESSTQACNCPTVTEPPTCPPCENTTPNNTTLHPSSTMETSTHECNCPTVTEVQCPTTPEPPSCPPCEHTTPYMTSVTPSQTMTTQECNCPTVSNVPCPTTHEPPTCPPCEHTTQNWTAQHSSSTTETTSQECTCPTVPDCSTSEIPTCPPCQCTTETLVTGLSTSMIPESTFDPCSLCTTHTAPVVTCPPCDWTSAFTASNHPSTSKDSSDSTSIVTDTTVKECTCPSCPEVPTTPCNCEHTSTTLSTSTVITTNATADTSTSCPEVTCTPCDCTTTPLSPNTTDATTPTCTPCPEVTTYSSTASTPEGHNTTSGHTITSSGAHSTSHGTNGTHSTTTPGPSHSDTTTHSWFPTGATGTTCVCPEPTCPPCTSETTTVHSPSTKPITTTTSCPVCPVTCPTPETTTEHHGISTSTNSHGITTTTNSHGSDATTTSGSSQSNTTASSGVSTTIGSSSTTECHCPTCPEVTTVYTTTDSHHTGNIQSSSITTTQQTPSSGTTLSTGSSVTPVPTTTGLSSPSQSGSTFSQWISHSTSHESSSSTNCNCPTCPETTSTPPTHGSLSFPVDGYIKQMMAGDIGHITWVKATPTPPGIINVQPIQYGLAGLTADLKDELKITENGELLAKAPIQPSLYKFQVTAEIPGVTEEATCDFTLKVMAASFCQNGSDTEVIFPLGFMTRTVEESHKSLTLTTFMRPDNLTCIWSHTEKPDLGKVKIEDDKTKKYITISVDGIDREDDKFNGAVSPTILAEITGSCVINESSSVFSNEDDDDISTTHSTLAILIHVTDVNDCAPTFESDKLVVGYPEKKIADVETPESMGTAVAHDDDVGKNAIISYSVSGTDEIIINEGSGQFYPHPNNFQFKNMSFKIIASDGYHQNTMDVLVKILEPKYITVLGIEGKTLEDVPKITEMIAESTGLQIGVISARVEKVDVKKEKHLPKEHHLPKEFVPHGDDNVEDPQVDDTLYLRLVVYALNGSEPVSVDQFNSSVNEIASESKWKVQDYHGMQRTAAASDSGSEGLLAGVIALSTILVLVILGIVAVFVYRRRLQMRGRGGGSLEKGLVSGNSGSENSSMEGGRDNSSIVFESVTEKGEPGQNKDEFPDGEAPSAERKKSVAFAEETMVIPSEEELEVMPAESGKGNDALGGDEIEEDIRM